MTKFTEQEYTKAAGGTLSHTEWNKAAQNINDLIDASGNAGGVTGGSDMSSYFYMNDKGNLCIETTAENTPSGKKGKLNIESNDDIQLKPGDDIMLYGDHRGEGKTDEVSIKVMDGTGNDDVPAKLQINMSEITLTTKDKTGDDANVLDINVNRAKNTKGYLKVRAQAIDLRCEENGGIALQPKGTDGQGHMNKIKFEHDGGDGKEFGTFNTEKTSIFTDEYRFNENGTVYAVTRGDLETTYKTPGDPNSGIKKIDYPTQEDDFKDILDVKKSCKWKDIVNVTNTFKNKAEIPHAWYVFPYNDGAYTYDTLSGNTVAVPVGPTPGPVDATWSVSQSNLDNMSAVAGTTGTKYIYSTDLLDVLGVQLGNSINPQDQAFYEQLMTGEAYFTSGSTVYMIKESSDSIKDIVITYKEVNGVGQTVKMSELHDLIEYMKTNSQGPWGSQL